MSQYYFYLSLDGIGENRIDDSLIANILKVPVKNGNIECPNDLPATDDVVFYHELKWLLDLVEPHKKELITAGISFENSSIWMIYGYFNQCNMEFDAPILKRIGDLSLKMCVSCYEDEKLENRESFNSELIRNPQEGI